MNRWVPSGYPVEAGIKTPAFILYLPSILYPLYCIFFAPYVFSQCILSIPILNPTMFLSCRRFYPKAVESSAVRWIDLKGERL